jgi:hypothetical protein
MVVVEEISASSAAVMETLPPALRRLICRQSAGVEAMSAPRSAGGPRPRPMYL